MENLEKQIQKFSEQIIPWILNHGIKIIFIIIGAFILNRILMKFIEKAVRIAVVTDGFSSQEAEKKREDTLIQIFSLTIKIVIITITVLMVLQEFGVLIAPILAAAGIVGLAFGFGGQYLIRDIISGLFIILENQYRIGDVVDFNIVSGMVEKISLRKTTLRDMDGTVHHIAHGEIKSVSNLTKDFARVNLNIGIAYKSDLEFVIQTINQIGIELSEDPKFKESIISPPQFLRVDDFADSAIIIKIVGDTLPLKKWEIAGELRKRIKIGFDKNNIEIPFPQVVVHQNKNNEPKTD